MDSEHVQKSQAGIEELLAACKEALTFVLRAVEADYRREGFDPAEHVLAKRLAAVISAAEPRPGSTRHDLLPWPGRHEYIGSFTVAGSEVLK